MKNHDPAKSWQRLLAAARKAPPPADEAAPFGFSTRVASLAFSRGDEPASAFGKMSLRAAAVACLLAVAAVAVNFSAIRSVFEEPAAAPAGDDPIAEVVDLGS